MSEKLRENAVSGAFGTAQQFMPNSPNVYQQQLRGVQQVGSPMKRFNNTGDLLETGLSQLGVAWQRFSNDEEERAYTLAKETAPQVFLNMTEEQKHQLTTRQLLSASGKFELQDNDYAVAIIDRLKGSEVAKNIETDWEIYKEGRRTKPTLDEEFKNFDEFYEAKLGEYIANEAVDNQWAFNNGLAETRSSTKLSVHQEFRQKTEERLKQERFYGMLSKFGAWSRNNMNASEEDLKTGIGGLVAELRATAGSDSDLEYKLLQGAVEAVAKTGQTKAIEAMADIEYFDGKKIGEMIDLSAYKDLANVTATKIQNERYNTYNTELSKLDTEAGVNQFFEKIQKESPEDYRMIIDQKEQKIAEIKRKEEQRLRDLQRQQQQSGAVNSGMLMANAVYNALVRGDTTVNGMNFPMSDSDVKAKGGDPESFLSTMNQLLATQLNNGNYNGMEYILSNSYVGGYMRKQMGDQLGIGLEGMTESTTTLPQAVQYAVTVYRDRPHLVNQLLPKEYVGKVQALGSLIETMGETQGIQIFGKGMQVLRDPNTARVVETEVNDVKFGQVGMLDVSSGEWSNFTIDPIQDGELTTVINEQAYILRATGQFTAQQAKDKATANIMHSYVRFKGVNLPERVLRNISVSSEKYASEGLNDVLEEHLAEAGAGATMSYDSVTDTVHFRKIGALGESKSIPLTKLTEEANNLLYSTTAEERQSRRKSATTQPLSEEQMNYINVW